MLHRLGVVSLALSCLVTPVLASDQPLEVMHYWVSGSERAALDVVKNAYTKRGGTWIDNPQVSNLELHRVFADRLTTGTAPTALQWQGGSELKDMADIGLIADYDALAQRNHWDNILSDAVKGSIKYDGHYFLAPTGVHSENWLFYNVKVLKDAGLSPPTTMAELLDQSEKLAAAGIVPISLGKSDWEAREVFMAVLVSVLGPDDFRRLVERQDVSVLEKPQGLATIRMFQALARSFLPDDRRPAGWAEATAAVGTGKAAFIIQGDWAKGELKKLGHRVGEDFGCELVPGTETVLSVAVDTFAFPRSIGVDTTAARDMFIESVMDPAVQTAFSQIKGSVPARTDIDDTKLDACAAIAQKLLRTPNAVMDQPIRTMPTTLVADLHILVNRMVRDRSLAPETALADLKAIFGHQDLANSTAP